MTLEDILGRLDRREYETAEGHDFVRSALIGLINGAANEGHEARPDSSCFICQALVEMVAVAEILDNVRDA